MKARVSEADLEAARAQLARDAEGAMAAMKDALRHGGATGTIRAKLVAIEAAIEAHAAQVEAIRAEADAARQRGIREEGRRIATHSADRLRFVLASLAAPRRPAILRHRVRA